MIASRIMASRDRGQPKMVARGRGVKWCGPQQELTACSRRHRDQKARNWFFSGVSSATILASLAAASAIMAVDAMFASTQSVPRGYRTHLLTCTGSMKIMMKIQVLYSVTEQ